MWDMARTGTVGLEEAPMIDLHCHLLPGLDDGAADLADSVGMGWQAAAAGITHICATPHIRHDHDVRIYELPDRVALVNDALDAAGCPVEVLTGGEVAETIVEHLTDDELHAVSLGGTGRWILLEPAPGPLSDSLDATVRALAARGYGSLLAHPERHLSPDMIDRLVTLVRDGALVQVTAATLAEHPASIGMRLLAEAGVVHVLGSDAHSSRAGRPVDLSAGLRMLGEVDLMAPHLDWVARTAPHAIVTGQAVVPPFTPRPDET
jgi:protein-tyrosine phosphatase